MTLQSPCPTWSFCLEDARHVPTAVSASRQEQNAFGGVTAARSRSAGVAERRWTIPEPSCVQPSGIFVVLLSGRYLPRSTQHWRRRFGDREGLLGGFGGFPAHAFQDFWVCAFTNVILVSAYQPGSIPTVSRRFRRRDSFGGGTHETSIRTASRQAKRKHQAAVQSLLHELTITVCPDSHREPASASPAPASRLAFFSHVMGRQPATSHPYLAC